ncbi:MAG: hypothetical protein MUC91_05485 [Verrucomicrobia bacterium]|nr:hypothetical protein [Verrucomicrobiota bacterium]
MAVQFEMNLPGRSGRANLGCLCLFLAPFFGVGLVFLWIGFRDALQGDLQGGLPVAGFALLFLGFAGLFLWLGIRSNRQKRALQVLREQCPDQPWLWRPDWRSGRIQSSEGKSAVLLWIMALAFIGLSLPAVLAIPSELEKGNKPILVALVFPLAGIGLATGAARATIRQRNFGRSELELHTLPGVIGGTLSGALEIPSKVRSSSGFKLRLLCLKRTTSGSGKNRSTHESVLWEEEKTLLRDFMETEPDRTGLPIFFNIPFDQPQSLSGNPAILWRLEVNADVPGVDYAAQFEVPVFRTAESRPDAAPAPDPTASFQPSGEAWQPPLKTRIQVTETLRGETELYFPAARNTGALAALLAFLAIWTGVLWFLLEAGAPMIFPIVFGFFEVLLLVFAVQGLFHAVRITANRDQIELRNRLLLFKWRNVVASSDVQSIQLKTGMQSGTKVYYDIQLVLKSGGKRSAGSRIPDKKHAQWLVKQLERAIGLC